MARPRRRSRDERRPAVTKPARARGERLKEVVGLAGAILELPGKLLAAIIAVAALLVILGVQVGIPGTGSERPDPPTVTIDKETDGNVERAGTNGVVFQVTLGLVGHDGDDYRLVWWLIDDANDRRITKVGRQTLPPRTFRQPVLCDVWTPYPRVAEFIRLRVELRRIGGGRTRKDSVPIELGGIDPDPPAELGAPGEADCA
jgi:hypothetical protein